MSSAGGCGTSVACRKCGAVNSVLAALVGSPMTTSVELSVESRGKKNEVRFEICSLPLPVGNRTFALIRIDHPSWLGAN
jgi:hypothetical protein